MTNYNDGKWHGWNGGGCPVHYGSKVCGVEAGGTTWCATAGENDWLSFRGAFRVIKEQKEPREYWLVEALGGGFVVNHSDSCGGIHVREVLE